MFVKIENVTKSFGSLAVLKNICFSVEAGEIASIIGPSGVGKTTLLTIIAGLEKPDAGRIVYETPPSRRHPVILVFQDYTLFPNMTVFENVAFGLRVRHVVKPEIKKRVHALIDYFQLSDKRDSYPAELSAGQKQRVAIARAMVVEPSLLLLDEPFANLDRGLKMDTARFIRQTQKEFKVATVAVTHDLDEAFAMSDKIGVMLDGRLEQYGDALEIYHQPSNIRVADFLGPVNRIPTSLLSVLGVKDLRPGPGCIVFARPEGISLEKNPNGAGLVETVTFVGRYTVCQVRLNDTTLTVHSVSDDIRVGDRVDLKLTRCHLSEERGS